MFYSFTAIRLSTLALTACLLFALPLTALAQSSVRITEQAFTVAPGKIVSFAFDVPERYAHAVGRFRASGGARNDIRALIMDAEGFENYRNGNQFTYYYDSGRVTVATVDRPLPPGHFFVVFDNQFSVVSNKAVTADILLEWR